MSTGSGEKVVRIMLRPSWGGGLWRVVQAGSLRDAVVGEVAAKRPLSGTHLGGADLSGACLRGAYLGGACLSGADLSGANLRGACLSAADLKGADLSGADLKGADFSGAYLEGADFSGAYLNWRSHALLSHILSVAAGKGLSDPLTVPRRMVAGLVSASTDLCWPQLLALPIDADLRAWALDTLAACIVEGDDAPEKLLEWRDGRGGGLSVDIRVEGAKEAAEGLGRASAAAAALGGPGQ